MEDVARQVLRGAAELREPDLQHLAGVVPFVERRRGIQPLIALETDQPPAEPR